MPNEDESILKLFSPSAALPDDDDDVNDVAGKDQHKALMQLGLQMKQTEVDTTKLSPMAANLWEMMEKNAQALLWQLETDRRAKNWEEARF